MIVVDNKPQTPQKQPTETIFITTEPEPVRKEESQPTVIVLQEPEPPPRQSPEVVYITNGQPVPQKQPSQTVSMIDENDPSQGGYYTPSPRQYHSQERHHYRSTPRSHAPSVSPRPRQQKKERSPPKYQLQPKPDQPTTLVGGVLIIDNDPWEAQSKVNHHNPNYRRRGGDVVIPQDKLKWKGKPRVDDKNVGYVRGGGNVPILHENLAWDGKPRIDAHNPDYHRGGGNVVIVHENLKWSKNARRKARSQPTPMTTRSLDSSGHESHVHTDDTLSEGAPSNNESKPNYRDYLHNKKPATEFGGYASQFRGKIHRYKATNGAVPYLDLQKRKPLLKTEDDLIVMEEPKQPPPVKAVMNTQKPARQPKPNVPWFKQKPVKPENTGKPTQYYPTKNMPLPPIGNQNKQALAPQPRPKYVLPEDKSLPWQHKEEKVEKISTKTLNATGKQRKKVPAIVPYNSNYNQRYEAYDNNGYQDYNDYGNQYGQVHNGGGYKNNYQDREHLRENNKYAANHKHHHFPSRKRNEPVY